MENFQNARHSTRAMALCLQLPKLSPTIRTREFTRFLDLPFELRKEIWRCVSFHPRTVALIARNIFSQSNFSTSSYHVRAPAVVHACSESREEALKHYTAVAQIIPGSGPTSTQADLRLITFINFEVDTFCHYTPDFGTTLFYSMIETNSYNFGLETLKRIKFLDLNVDKVKWDEPPVRWMRLFEVTSELKRLRLVAKVNDLDLDIADTQENVPGHLQIQEQGGHFLNNLRWLLSNHLSGVSLMEGNLKDVEFGCSWVNNEDIDLDPSEEPEYPLGAFKRCCNVCPCVPKRTP